MKRLKVIALIALGVMQLGCMNGSPHAGVRADPPVGIWTSAQELALCPMSGAAWEHLIEVANEPAGQPEIRNKDDNTDVRVLAKALVYARTGQETYRAEVVRACRQAIWTEQGGDCLALGRNLVGYVIAADLVTLPPDVDGVFRTWLEQVLTEELAGRTLQSTHEDRPNNWGTHAGASRAAVALYLHDEKEIARVAEVFKGWLGDRSSYDEFSWGELWWQADPENPVGINPQGALRQVDLGPPVNIDGVLPDDQRRGGAFEWPPPQENYVYEALQGALVQAVILHRIGYDVWNWEDQALRRAFTWLHELANYPAQGDDTWQPHVVNRFYDSTFPAPIPAATGKNMGWTDWTLSGSGTR